MSLLCCNNLAAGRALLSTAALASSSLLSSPSPVFTSLTSKRSLQASPRTFAKRKPTSSSPPPQLDEPVLDEDLKNSINELSTQAVKIMLSDNMRGMGDLRDKLFDLEIYFEKENEEDALLFVLSIRDMLDHKILPEAKQLKGIYMKAFQKIFSMVEDSGWRLKGNDDESEVRMIDDDLIPPTLMSEYR
ncbi:hypothetical protein GOP47_0006349 [Adiantum capillus-veneris]|uniref:Uncharacterized protein n=1 Tax=Adiantum capillus-veneris TaxID=13818 RepID=A0A9D4V3P2_ADICA|nr:hypothetical protein GOP47_0006349 [Adiantum capillus-veneris]